MFIFSVYAEHLSGWNKLELFPTWTHILADPRSFAIHFCHLITQCKFLRCRWKAFPVTDQPSVHILWHICVRVRYLNSSVWQEPKGMPSSHLLSCQGSHIQAGQRATVCHRWGCVHIGCIPCFTQRIWRKLSVCRACIALEGNNECSLYCREDLLFDLFWSGALKHLLYIWDTDLSVN